MPRRRMFLAPTMSAWSVWAQDWQENTAWERRLSSCLWPCSSRRRFRRRIKALEQRVVELEAAIEDLVRQSGN